MASSSGSEYPLVDFSDIPGCESPISTGRSFRMTDSSLASSTVSKSTKSRISSIFSQASTLDTSDDDVFSVKSITQSARKIKHSHHHHNQKTKISTGLLIEIEEQIESSPNSSLTDWERLKKEAQAIAGEMTGESTSKKVEMNVVDKVIDFDEILSKSPLAGSPLFATRKNLETLSPLSPPPKRLIDFDDIDQDDYLIQKSMEGKENNCKKENQKCSNTEQEVYLDDQLERAIIKQQQQRVPLSTLNRCTNDPLLTLKNDMTPKKFVKTPNSKIIATPQNSKIKSYRTPALKPVVGPRIGTYMSKNSTATFPAKNKQPSIMNKRVTPLSSLPPKERVKPSPNDRRTLMKPIKDFQKYSENCSAITTKNTPLSLHSNFRENTTTARASSSVKINLTTRRSLLPNKEATPKLPSSLVARRSLLPNNNLKNTPKVSSNILKTNLTTRRSLLPNKGSTTTVGNIDNISSSGIKKISLNCTPSSSVSKHSISSFGPATRKNLSHYTPVSSSVSKSSSENLIKSRRRSDLPKPTTTTRTISKPPSKIGSALSNKPYSVS